MSTLFSGLYRWIRYEVLRDDNSEVLPEDDLDLALEYQIEFTSDFEAYAVTLNGDSKKQITPALSKTDKHLLILKSAYSLLEPEDAFSYKTAVLSKTLEGTPGLEEQKKGLLERIRELENEATGGIPLVSDNEFDTYYNEAERFENTITRAEASD